MKTAWIYAGQGSQKPGMGQDFYESYPEIRHIFDSQTAGFDLREMCFNSDMETLSQTRYTQPSMAAFAAAVTLLLEGKGLYPDFTAGLSLGEYSALYASKVFDFEVLLDLLAFRGKAMEDSALGVKSRMVAVLGLSEDLVRKAVEEASRDGVVACTNVNCPGQIVIGGEEGSVIAAENLCLELGARQCIVLNTSGPFHTPLMEKASIALTEKLSDVDFSPQQVPVVFNYTGDTAPDKDIPAYLAHQVKSTVLFEKTIETLRNNGVTNIIEIGPGRVLASFVRKTAREIKVHTIQTVEDFLNIPADFIDRND